MIERKWMGLNEAFVWYYCCFSTISQLRRVLFIIIDIRWGKLLMINSPSFGSSWAELNWVEHSSNRHIKCNRAHAFHGCAILLLVKWNWCEFWLWKVSFCQHRRRFCRRFMRCLAKIWHECWTKISFWNVFWFSRWIVCNISKHIKNDRWTSFVIIWYIHSPHMLHIRSRKVLSIDGKFIVPKKLVGAQKKKQKQTNTHTQLRPDVQSVVITKPSINHMRRNTSNYYHFNLMQFTQNVNIFLLSLSTSLSHTLGELIGILRCAWPHNHLLHAHRQTRT